MSFLRSKRGGGAISWEVRKQQTTALSTSEAEYQSLSAACPEALFLRSLLEDLGYKQKASTTIQEDNQSCIKIAENPVLARRTKHIETKHHFVRDLVKQEVIKLVYCSTENLTADLLTKPLARVKVQKHRKVILGRVDLEEEF